jgi:hypothetical protein
MFNRCIIGAVALVTALGAATAPGFAHDEGKYPDLKGAWIRADRGQATPWDPSKPPGRGQQAPLTPEYQAMYDAALARKAAGIDLTSCLPPGMPRSMIVPEPMELIVMPDTTYIMLTYMSEFRRIYTDGRKFADDIEPAFSGFSIGKWEDTDNDGRFDALVVENRGMKGPRSFDDSGLPLHKDNETIVRERISLDKSDPNLLHDEITTIDHALTRPWTATSRPERLTTSVPEGSEACRRPVYTSATAFGADGGTAAGRGSPARRAFFPESKPAAAIAPGAGRSQKGDSDELTSIQAALLHHSAQAGTSVSQENDIAATFLRCPVAGERFVEGGHHWTHLVIFIPTRSRRWCSAPPPTSHEG